MNYYKIPPEWAKKLGITDFAIIHPDGWYLALPTRVRPLFEMLPAEEYGVVNSIEEAVRAIGGCIYTEEEAMQSQKGNPEFMMNREDTPTMEVPKTDAPEESDTATPSPLPGSVAVIEKPKRKETDNDSETSTLKS